MGKDSAARNRGIPHPVRAIGGQILSEVSTADKVDMITLAIQQRRRIDELARLSYSAQPWQSFLPARNSIVEACENLVPAESARVLR